MKKIFCILVFIICISCVYPEEQSFFTIENRSDHWISFYIGKTYPDTSISKNIPHIVKIEPRSKYKESDWGTWESRFSRIEKLSVFIFHSDTLVSNEWVDVCKYYKLLKRYDLSLEDLRKCNFIVSYPYKIQQ